MKLRVYYENTDSGGVVYHTDYLKFCERARSEIFFSKGEFFENRGFVVRNLEANFLKSAKLGDELNIVTKFIELKKVYVIVHQEIYKNDEKLFEVYVKLVFLEDGKIKKIPDGYLKIIDEYKKNR